MIVVHLALSCLALAIIAPPSQEPRTISLPEPVLDFRFTSKNRVIIQADYKDGAFGWYVEGSRDPIKLGRYAILDPAPNGDYIAALQSGDRFCPLSIIQLDPIKTLDTNYKAYDIAVSPDSNQVALFQMRKTQRAPSKS